MATPTLVGGTAYRSLSDLSTRNLALSTLVDNTGTTTAIQDGDFLLLFVFYAGSTTTNSVSGLTGLTKLDDNVATSGGTSTVYYKQNCVASTDATATIAIATSTANRTNAIAVVYRNVPATGTAILGYGKGFNMSGTSSASPTATPTAVGGVRVEFAMWGTNVSPTTIPAGDVSLTSVRTENTGTLPGHVGSMSTSAIASGTSTGNVAHNLTAATTTTAVGGTTWTTGEATGVSTKWTIILAPTVSVTSVRPASTISSTSVNLVGTAGTIVAALADELDTTLAETTDDPVSVVLEEKFAALGSNSRVGLNSKLQVTSSTGTGSVTFLVQIRQGASTVICSHTVVVAVTDGVVPDVLLGTTVETATITDWTDLRARWTMTKV